MHKHCEILVVGGGLVGLTAAYVLCRTGREVTLCAPTQKAADPRTTALLDGSVNYLNSLGLWEEVLPFAHPLKIMRLVDATTRLFRFQQTDFRSSEIGLEAFGYNVRNCELVNVLERKLADADNFSRIDGSLEALGTSQTGKITATIAPAGGKPVKLDTGFVVGADGRNSEVREHFGHGVRDWIYPQSALVLDFEHELDSRFTSTEFHTEAGPFTVVPQSSRRAGLVWLETPECVEQIKSLDEDTLNALVEEKMQSYLGKLTVVSRPHSFPMSGLTANKFGDQFHALVGEAAHVFPPIGAQGFNLGIRDVEELDRTLGRFTSTEKPGHQYHLVRSGDINTRTMGVDLLNRSLLSDFLPVQIVRAAGMFALGSVPPLRKRAMKLGISPFQSG